MKSLCIPNYLYQPGNHCTATRVMVSLYLAIRVYVSQIRKLPTFCSGFGFVRNGGLSERAAIPRAVADGGVADSPGSLARSVMQMDPSTSRGGMKAACGTQIIMMMMMMEKFSGASGFGSPALFSDFKIQTTKFFFAANAATLTPKDGTSFARYRRRPPRGRRRPTRSSTSSPSSS